MKTAAPFIFLALLLLASGCARLPIKTVQESMRKTVAPALLEDDLGLSSLREGIRTNAEFLRKKGRLDDIMVFGPRSVRQEDYIKALEMLLADTDGMTDVREFAGVLKAEFDFYEVYGKKEWGEVFITSYYTPVIEGSTIPTPRFPQPLYGVPPDLVWVNLNSFARRFPEMMPWQGLPNEQKTKPGILRGRLCPCPEKGCVPEVAPYYSRKEIDEERRLADQGLEFAWLDPIDCFFLQIQGAGVVNLDNGMRLRVGYASQNGHPYVAIGKFMYDVIPPQKMSMQAIRRHLKTMAPDELQEMLNKNPSYVFFRTLPGDPVTYLGTEVVDGRTIATDTRFFPKGALAYLEFEKPEFPDEEAEEPTGWVKTSRFVLDQDTGGAIRGPDRVDLYWGEGRIAEQHAGVMKNQGRLYYLVPKAAD